MKPSLTKVVDAILRCIEEGPEAVHTEKGMRSWLKRLGFNKREIDAAMKLVAPRLSENPGVIEHRLTTVRVLSAEERARLTPEARAALERLDFYGLIDPYEREMLLDRLSQYEGEVGMDELDGLLSWLVLSVRDVESQQTIYDVIDGSNSVRH